MVYRIYTEKKEGLRTKADALMSDIKTLLGIERLRGLRLISRYDVEGISEELFDDCRWTVFAEPPLDNASGSLHGLTGLAADENGFVYDEEDENKKTAYVFAYETLPGTDDQRAMSAEECIRMAAAGSEPAVRSADVCVLYGELMPADIDAITAFVIDPASKKRASLELSETLTEAEETAQGEETQGAEESAQPEGEKVLEGFRTMTYAEMRGCISAMGLAMDEDDVALCVRYFEEEHRDPTEAELRIIDLYRSEDLRHTTFNTVIDSVTIEDPVLERAYMDYLAVRKSMGQDKPVTLDDIAAIASRHFRREGMLEKAGKFGRGGVCSVMINAEIDGENEPWLLFFGNGMSGSGIEDDPRGAAAECFTDCVSEVLSARAYPYAVMRLSGAADPLQHVTDTLPGRRPQRTLDKESAAGAAECASLAGIATGMVDEVCHPGFAAGRLESYAVLAAVPSVNIRREKPEKGDIVMLVSGEDAGGLYRMQRFFRDGVAVRMMKRCVAVGDGGIYAAAAQLADGLDFDLDSAAAGLGRGACMACIIEAENEKVFTLVAAGERLLCVKAGEVTDNQRLVMRSGGAKTVDLSMGFLLSGGAEKHIDIVPEKTCSWKATHFYGRERSFTAGMHVAASDLNVCSKRGLAGGFDSTPGTGTVLMPFGGDNQMTPVQAMVNRLPLAKGSTDDCTMMAWGYDPVLSAASPYHGAYLAVTESVSKLIASGAPFREIYLMLRGRFAAPGRDGAKWGRPLAAVLGAFEAQTNLGLCSVCGSDTISEGYEGLDVPASAISYAVTACKADNVVTPEFKSAGHRVVLLKPYTEGEGGGALAGLPDPASQLKVWEKATAMLASGEALAAYTPGAGGVAAAVMKMAFGNGIGFRFEAMELEELFGYAYGSVILEVEDSFELTARHMEIELLGHTAEEQEISFGAEKVSMAELLSLYEGRLESVYPTLKAGGTGAASNTEYRARSWNTPLYKRAEPKVLIPVFPGTNCEYDAARAVREAGASPEILVIKNRSLDDIKRSAEVFTGALSGSQMILLPGGYSGFGGPEGAAGLTEAFFRRPDIAEAVTTLLDKKEGLMCGISDGFQALIRLGLVPYGKITDANEDRPALMLNTIGRAQSVIARVRIASNKSPWLRYSKVGDVYLVPLSCTWGRFTASEEELKRLAGTGQIATQYAGPDGNATADIRFNPTGSMMAVEGITSPDGRVIGRMGHAERNAAGLYRNVPGSYVYDMFANAVRYYK